MRAWAAARGEGGWVWHHLDNCGHELYVSFLCWLVDGKGHGKHEGRIPTEMRNLASRFSCILMDCLEFCPPVIMRSLGKFQDRACFVVVVFFWLVLVIAHWAGSIQFASCRSGERVPAARRGVARREAESWVLSTIVDDGSKGSRSRPRRKAIRGACGEILAQSLQEPFSA